MTDLFKFIGAAIGSVVGGPLGLIAGLGVGAGAGALAKGKGKSAQPLPGASRDDAAATIDRQDEMRRRKGSAADMILDGSTGGEAAISPGKLVLGT